MRERLELIYHENYELRIESRVGCGTTVVVVVPRGLKESRRNGHKILPLPPDRFDKIYLAANGREALDIILRDRPDILFLDVQMPLLTGIEVMQEAKRADALPYTMV